MTNDSTFDTFLHEEESSPADSNSLN